MTESEISRLALIFFVPSILAVFVATVFSFTALKFKKLLYRYGSRGLVSLLSLSLVAFGLLVGFGIGGCFESCSGKIDDEVGLMFSSNILLAYSFVLVLVSGVETNIKRL